MDELLNSGSASSSEVNSSLNAIQQISNPSKAELGAAQLAEDFDTFLLLLTTQLQNQDPTEQLDTNEFTNQLVQFASVEQALATNENLEELVALENSNSLSSAINYVGQFVDAEGNAGVLDDDGYASFAYELDVGAASVSIIITDSAGRAVFQGEGPTGAGVQRVVWDGVNAFTRQQEPQGTYNIFVNATNSSGEELTDQYRSLTTGAVIGAEIIDGEVILNVAGTNVPVETVKTIRQPVVTNTGSGDTAADDTTDDDTDAVS